MCRCSCACVRVRVRVCVCVCVCGRVGVRVCVRALVRARAWAQVWLQLQTCMRVCAGLGRVSGASALLLRGSETAVLRPLAGLGRLLGASAFVWGQGSETVLLRLLHGLGRFLLAPVCLGQGFGLRDVWGGAPKRYCFVFVLASQGLRVPPSFWGHAFGATVCFRECG